MSPDRFIKVVVYRSAVTGLFVPVEYARKHPKTTVREVIRRRRRRR